MKHMKMKPMKVFLYASACAVVTVALAFGAPAAVAVLTGEDILRSGAGNVPEALRWVPGMNVAQFNSSQWAVSMRGFNELYADKLLVMLDGRSVYIPTTAGVSWEDLGPMLQNLGRRKS